ncbi:MAG: MTH938/NDUFAF3 family protein [Gammaproteobacteria bacterium]
MKLDFDTETPHNSVTAYADGWVRIGDQRIEQACVITARGIYTDLLPPAITALSGAHIERLAELDADIVLLGTGAHQRFIDYAHVQWLAERGIGLEMMDTGAACRSYNVLVAEGRAVAAALYMI